MQGQRRCGAMEGYTTIKRDKIVPFKEIWGDLETVIQSEVSQKKKNKYHILTHKYEVQRNRTDELVCKAEKQRHRG